MKKFLVLFFLIFSYSSYSQVCMNCTLGQLVDLNLSQGTTLYRDTTLLPNGTVYISPRGNYISVWLLEEHRVFKYIYLTKEYSKFKNELNKLTIIYPKYDSLWYSNDLLIRAYSSYPLYFIEYIKR